MNIHALHTALENPLQRSQLDPTEVEKLLRDFPYFPAAQVLLAQLYLDKSDHRFTDQLHQAATYSGNRKLLRHLIHQRINSEVEIPQIRIQVDNYQPAPTDQKIVDAGEPPIPVLDIEPAQIIDEEVPQAATTDVDLQAEHTSDIPPEPTDHQPKLEPIAKEILVHAVSSTIELEVAEDATEFRDTIDEKITEALPQEKNPIDYTYESWLSQRAEDLHFGESDSSAEASLLVEFDESAPSIAHGKTRIATDLREQQRDLIDRFIREEPRISTGRLNEFEIGDLAKTSLADDLSFVTETMARLYEQQGKPDKARKVYQKLMTDYPEKSIYFAALLKNLDKTKK